MRKLWDIGKLVLFGAGLILFYMLVDVIVDGYLLGQEEQGFGDELFRPDLHEIYDRVFVFMIVAALAIVAQVLITRTRQARDRLDQQLRFQQTLIDSIPEAIFYKDAEGVFLGCNEAFAGYLAIPKEQVRGKTAFEIAERRVAQTYERADQEALLTRTQVSYETRVPSPGGERIVIVNESAYLADDGEPAGVIGTMIDVTERNEAEKAVASSEKQLRDIASSIGDGIYVLDQNGRLVFMNPAAERLWGWSEEELRGRQIHDVVHFQHLDGRPFPSSECPVLAIFRTHAAFRTDDDYFTHRDGTIFPVAYIATPVIDRGRLIAVVSVFQDVTRRKEAERLSEALNDINDIIHSTLDIDEIMQLVKHELALEMGCDATALTMRSDDQWRVQYVHGFPEGYEGRTLYGTTASHLNLVHESRNPLVINDARRDRRIDRGLVDELGIRSLLSVPLIVKKEVIGDICFAYLGQRAAFSQPQVDFAVKAAASVSLAVENARLYDAEHNIAHTLQDAILTLPVRIPGVEIGHLYRSATETLEVGGDFYDLFELEHDRVGITIGDISGKGLEAAALTSLIKNSVKAYAHVYNSAATIIEKTNHLVVEATEESAFATLFFAILDRERRTLRWCRAGHPPPILLEDGRPTLLMDGSPPVGAFHETAFVEHEMRMATGQKLILYTDGVIEAKRDGALFGERKLIDTVTELKMLPAGDLPVAIYQEVVDFSQGRLSDDIALLTLELKE